MHDAFGVPWTELYDPNTKSAWTVKFKHDLETLDLFYVRYFYASRS
jgi:hypothetical protein